MYLGRRPETGVRGSFYGVWPVVYEAESSELIEDFELVLRRDRQVHVGTELGLEPGFQVGTEELRVVVGYEVDA